VFKTPQRIEIEEYESSEEEPEPVAAKDVLA